MTPTSLAGIAVSLAVGAGIAWAGSQGGLTVAIGSAVLPLFALCVIASFVVQWVVFIPSYIAQTEHYYDLTGSLTYIALTAVALTLGNGGDARALLIGAMVLMWALRLGTFLFRRVRADGSDGRFDRIKPDFLWFLMAWTMQALWVPLTLAAALVVFTTEVQVPLDGFAAVGALMWGAGFAIEVIADQQKRAFRSDPTNEGEFIRTGLWAWSRHPNYFGEILLWTGIAVIALPVLAGWQFAALISPVFVFILLNFVSGVPMLEKRAEKRWGTDPVYRQYVKETPVLIPRPPRLQPAV
ncbi:MAG: DUF1295 domain-containing protein [Pseudomonadota bacterium]